VCTRASAQIFYERLRALRDQHRKYPIAAEVRSSTLSVPRRTLIESIRDLK
jgi:hypothetical protein